MSQQSATVDKRPSHQRASRMNERQGAGHTPPGRPAGETAGIAEPSVSVRELDIAFGAHKVISGLDLDVSPGEFIVLLGPSGCGKSTLLNAIAGLLDISDGEIWIDGKNVTWAEPKDRGIGMVFQSYALYPRMSVEKNLSFGLRISKLPKAEIDGRVARVAELLQLDGLLKRRPSELSGGQRQRVAIGRAITRDPQVFLFDEPLSNLDAALRVQTRIEIARLHEKMAGTTMIYVTHDQVEAMTLADRIVVLNKGHVEQVGGPMELYNSPDNLFVAKFLGSPSMNILPARIESVGAATRVVPEGGSPVDLPIAAVGTVAGGAGHLGIRPEDLSLTDEANPPFRGTVVLTESLGEVTLVYVDIGRADEPFVAKLPGEVSIPRGSQIGLTARPQSMRLFDEAGQAVRPQVRRAA